MAAETMWWVSTLNIDTVLDEDRELIASAQAGDHVAMETLIRKYGYLVRIQTRAYFMAGADWEDVQQEGMIGLFKAIRDYRTGKGMAFQGFAKLCITRQIITAIKTATRQKHLPLNGYVSLNKPLQEFDSRTLENVLECKVLGPEDTVIQTEHLLEMQKEMAIHLSELERQILLLRLQGIPYKSIAELLNRSYKSVDNAVWRVSRKLRHLTLA